MIHYIDRSNLDVNKYNACIATSMQKRIYAYSWYLDCVASNWSVLVFKDYEAVMPLPWNKKFGIKYITQPYFTQQLGVFSTNKLSLKEEQEIINAIPKKFLKIQYQGNSSNNFSTSTRTNYILTLNQDYSILFKAFSKGRKHAVKSVLKSNLKIVDFNVTELINLARNNYSFTLPIKSYEVLESLLSELKKREKVLFLGVRNEAGELLGASAFVLGDVRVIYLFSALNVSAKKLQIPSLLIHHILEKYQNSSKILDFEGSSIASIASFFKSFGAKEECYPLLQKSFLK